MSEASVNIDIRPWVVAEVGGRVASEGGAPVFHPDSSARWLTALNRCVGKEVRVRLIRKKARRSLEANAFYWGVVLRDILDGLKVLADDAGELPVFTDEDELHDALKWRFLRRAETLVGGGNLERVPRSSKLSIAEFSAYVDAVILWAAERGITVRHAQEVA